MDERVIGCVIGEVRDWEFGSPPCGWVFGIDVDPQARLAGEIAQRYGVSSHHLAKVLSELARAGVVESVRGVGGGYRFAANARRLTLMDVVSLFEDLGGEPSRREEGDGTPAGRALAAVLSEIDEIAKATFSTITLATMLRLIERQRAEASRAPPARPGAARAACRAP